MQSGFLYLEVFFESQVDVFGVDVLVYLCFFFVDFCIFGFEEYFQWVEVFFNGVCGVVVYFYEVSIVFWDGVGFEGFFVFFVLYGVEEVLVEEVVGFLGCFFVVFFFWEYYVDVFDYFNLEFFVKEFVGYCVGFEQVCGDFEGFEGVFDEGWLVGCEVVYCYVNQWFVEGSDEFYVFEEFCGFINVFFLVFQVFFFQEVIFFYKLQG